MICDLVSFKRVVQHVIRHCAGPVWDASDGYDARCAVVFEGVSNVFVSSREWILHRNFGVVLADPEMEMNKI